MSVEVGRGVFLAVPLLALCSLSVGPAHASTKFDTSLTAGIARTDNLTLAPVDPETETVYEAIPVFALSHDSTRLKTQLNYRVEGYRYANRRDSSVYQVYDAVSQVALDPDNFFFDVGASRDQTIANPEDPIPRSNLPITTNRINRDDYYAGPRFQYEFGSDGTVSGSYRRTLTRYGDSPTTAFIRDLDSDDFAFSLNNYRKQGGLTWSATYNVEKTDYGLPQIWEYRRAAVELGAWLAPKVRFFVNGGKESAWDRPFDPSLADGFSEAGFARRGNVLDFELAAGERTFGHSKRATLDYRSRRGRMEIRYVEQPTTEGRDRYRELSSTDLLIGTLADFLARPGVAQRFISKRLDWSFNVEMRRTRVSISAYNESRVDRTTIDGTPLPDESQSGGTLGAGWKLGARTELQLSVDRIRQEFGSGGGQDQRSMSIGAQRALGVKTSLQLALTRTIEDPVAGVGQRYDANLISVLVTRKF